MINFKELVKERDEMQVKIDEVRLRIKKFTDIKEEVPDWLWEEESTFKSYQESIINRIGCELTEEDIAVPVTVVNLGPEDFNDSKVENLGDIPFNLADFLKQPSEESSEDEEQCGCKDCTSEEEDAEDITGSIVKAFMLMGAIKALEAKKEGK
jgi:hypothetical protein